MPLSMMAFSNNFGGDAGSQNGEDVSTFSYLVQTQDKTVIKVTVEDANSENAFFTDDILFTTPSHYVKMQSALVSGKEVVIGLT